MNFTIKVEQEEDWGWLGQIAELLGTLVSGQIRKEALACIQPLAPRIVADRPGAWRGHAADGHRLFGNHRSQWPSHQSAVGVGRVAKDGE